MIFVFGYRYHSTVSAPSDHFNAGRIVFGYRRRTARSSISARRANREQPGGGVSGLSSDIGAGGSSRIEKQPGGLFDLRSRFIRIRVTCARGRPVQRQGLAVRNDSEFIEQQQTGDLRNAMNNSKRLRPIKIYMTINRELQGFIKSGLIKNVNWIEATRRARGLH